MRTILPQPGCGFAVRALSIGLLLSTGCAAPVAPSADDSPSVQPVGDANAAAPQNADRLRMRLEEIRPIPDFPAQAPVTDAAPSDKRASGDRELARAKQMFAEQLWPDALEAASRVIALDAANIEARVLLARAAIQLGDTAKARAALDEALRRSPRSAPVHYWLGELAWQEQNAAVAIAHFRLALRAAADLAAEPCLVLAHLSLAQALQREGYLAAAAQQWRAYLTAVKAPSPAARALPELQQVIPLYRGKAAAQLGDLYTKLGQPADAVEAFRCAMEEQPNEPSHRVSFALALARTGLVEEALAAVREAATAQQDAAGAIQLLEQVCDALKQPDRFATELVALVDRSDDPALRLRAVEALKSANQSEVAARLLEAYLARNPDDDAKRLELARLWGQSKMPDLALDTMGRLLGARAAAYRDATALLLEWGGGDASREWIAASHRRITLPQGGERSAALEKFMLGVLLEGARKPDLAGEQFRSAAAADPPFAPAWVMLARQAADREDWPGVLEAAAKAIDAGCADSQALTLKGRAHEALDEMESAETALMEAFAKDTKNSEPLRVLADAAEHRGDARRCEQLCRRIVEDVDPRDAAAREKLIRLYVNAGRIDDAQQHFSDFERLGQTGAAVDRCKALLDFVTSRSPSGQRRLGSYRRALRKLLEKHPDDADTRVDLALSHLAEGNYDSAEKELRAALAKSPTDRRALQMLATAQSRQLDFEAAERTVRQLLKRRPRDLGYHQQLAELLVDQDRYDDAVEILDKLLERDDLKASRPLYTARLLDVLLAGKRFDRAIEVARRWHDEEPADPARRQAYLVTLTRAKRHDDAIAAVEGWLKTEPTSDTLRAVYLDQLRQARRIDEALAHVLDWLADEPDDPGLNQSLVRLLWAARDWDSAIEVATTAAEHPPHRARFEAMLGTTYQLARRYDDAIAFYRRRIDRDEGEAAYRELILILMIAERYGEAEKTINFRLSALQQLRDTGEENVDGPMLWLRNRLAQVFQQTGRPTQAIQQLEMIHRDLPTDAGINNDLGYTYADLGLKLDKAERMIRLALAEQPRNGAYLDSLGWVFYKREDFPRAVAFIQRAVRLQEDEPDPILYDHLADALYRAGRPDEARTNWRKALAVRGETDSDRRDGSTADAASQPAATTASQPVDAATTQPARGTEDHAGDGLDPERDRPPTAEERRVLERIREKLRQIEAGQPVDTAPVGEEKPVDVP